LGARGAGRALEFGLRDATAPLILVTTSEELWTLAHLDPLLEAIDRCDHVVGRRRLSLIARIRRWVGRLPWRFLFAVPVLDVHSPCRLHRREKLAPIPFQSSTQFLDVEILAKATFFGHMIDEVDVPPLKSPEIWSYWHDLVEVFKRPVLVKPADSGPPEDSQRQVKGDRGPGGEDGQGGGNVEPAGPLEDHAPQGADQLGQREGLDEGLSRGGEPLGREEDPREEPHRQHDKVHEAADGLG
jgi:hypothetical protein